MEIKKLSSVRRLALVAVLGNFIALAVAAVMVPRDLAVLLPVVAMMLPLFTLSLLDRVVERRFAGHLPA